MKQFLTVLLVLTLILGLMVPSVALAYSNEAPIVGNDGLLVMSPEEYLGIDECDELYTSSSDHYTYVYTDRGIEYRDHGTDNPVDWYKMEDYIDALVDSGYYEVLEHEKPLPGTDYWYLGYIGPGSVRRTFHIGTSVTTDAAIIIRSFYGDIEVAYSLDIMTNDIEETQSRLGKSIFDSNPSGGNGGGGSTPSGGRTEERCGICGGSGKRNCGSCFGSGTVGYGSDQRDCPNFSCSGGKVDCWTCGGDGKK